MMRLVGGVARAACALAVLAAAAPASAASLPDVDSGHRPGPDILYASPPADVPQLENAAPWSAAPILVSGASAYRDGEWLYQDFLFDDRGATGAADPADPHGASNWLYAPKAGTLTYPTDPKFANNAADLVELRVKPLADATAFRVTLNTLLAPEHAAFTIALGSSPAALAWPHGAGVRSPAEAFLTVHGVTGELRDAPSGAVRGPAPSVSVDTRRRQIEVRVPRTAWDPGTRKIRLTVGVGLWNPGAGSYLAPGFEATETTPGGVAPSRAAIFNVGPRYDEPMPDLDQAGAGWTMADAAAGAAVQAAFWRDRAQADALRLGDVTRFAAEVDFAKLAAGADDDSRVPKTGPMNRILASRYSFGQGVDYSKVCFSIGGEATEPGTKCEGIFVGQLQPYALYVPKKAPPAGGYGLTLLLHSLSSGYNQYLASNNQSQFGERGAGSLVITPGGRGPDGFYTGIPEADTFEVWADVARHYPLDPAWAAVSGYSMGGFGTYRLLARWPDLFARGQSTVGQPTDPATLPSLRNTPIMAWTSTADELVWVWDTEAAVTELTRLGLRFESFLFLASDHLTLATNDEYGPAAEFLGSHRVDRNPAHVTYVVAPETDSAKAQAVADHAYWLSDLRLRDPKTTHGTIDARSEAFGVGDPPALGVEDGAGVLTGGSHGPMPYRHRSQEWGKAPDRAKADRLVVKADNVATATVDARRARLSCAPALDVAGGLDLRISCPTVRPRRCARTVRVKLPRVRGARIVSVTVMRGRRTVRRARGRNLRRVTFRRPTMRAFTVRVRARTSGGARRARSVTLVRRYGACRRAG